MSKTKKLITPNFTLDASEEDHVDNWLDDCHIPTKENEGLSYAKFVLDYMRMPAWKISAYQPFMEKHKLFCTFRGVRYRVVMASRLGTVGLNTDFNQDHGAKTHAFPKNCTDWSDKP